MNNVVCMKWGTKFPPEYVNILAANVKRNLSLPYRFVCFTDDASGLNSEIEVRPLPEMNISAHLPERGWRKLTIFQEKLADLEGTALFLDLDVIIAQSLNPFFEVPGEFRIIKDWNLGRSGIGNSSVFRFEIGHHPDVLSWFLEHREEVRAQHRNEQAYLSWKMKQNNILDYWEPSWCLSFKKYYMRSFPLGYFIQPRPIPETKVIVFHGAPNPDAIRFGWRSSNFLRAVRPTPWLAELWKE